MNRNQIAALSGAGLLVLGVFMPIISLPVVGSVTYFNNGQGDGVFVLVAAALVVILSSTKKYKWLLLPGLGTALLMMVALVRAITLINDAKAQLQEKLAGNPFAGLAEGLMNSVQLQWGWAVLFIGAGLVTVGAVLNPGATGAGEPAGIDNASVKSPSPVVTSSMSEGDMHSGSHGYSANTAYPDTEYGSGANFDEGDR